MDPGGLPDGSSHALLILFLLGLSAFASSCETAFFSLNRFQLRRIKERHKEAYQRIRALLRYPSRLLIMILLMNEIVNVTISTLVTELLQKHSETITRYFLINPSDYARWTLIALLSLAITLPVLLIVAEITPKFIAARMNKLVAIVNSKPLALLSQLMLPILWPLDAAISLTLRRFKADGRDHLSKTMSVLSEEDFMLLMEQGHKEGAVDQAEKKLIKNVFEFDDSVVSDFMTPIGEAFSISSHAKISEALPELLLQKYSRVPVYQKNRKKIVGILYIKDLLELREHANFNDLEVKSLMTPPMHVGPNVRLSILFRRFKESKTHMAVVVEKKNDEEQAVGVVTMDDLLESIFGDISDERDVR